METISNWVLWGGSLIGLSCLALTLVYWDRGSRGQDAGTFSDNEVLTYDELLRDRMRENGIGTFLELQEKSGLSRTILWQFRKGDINGINLSQVGLLADALKWDIGTILQKIGIVEGLSDREPASKPTASSNLPVTVSQESTVQDATTSQSDAEALRIECLRLREELSRQGEQLATYVRNEAFEQLRTLLTNYPSVREMVQLKPDLPAKNIISLFTPLDNLISSWGYSRIGQAWEQVPYDPQLHQPDNSDIVPGELVYVRFVGYREGDAAEAAAAPLRIICPAKVSRTLPGGAA